MGRLKEYAEHKDDPAWNFDKYGFAINLPEDHPARSWTRYAERSALTDKPFVIEDNFSDEFQAFLDMVFPGAQAICLTTPNNAFGAKAIELILEVTFEGERHSLTQILNPNGPELRSPEEFSRTRLEYYDRCWVFLRDKYTELCVICLGRGKVPGPMAYPLWLEFSQPPLFTTCPHCGGAGRTRIYPNKEKGA